MPNYIISIGGRGSQTLESLVYLCAMGSGPEELSVLMIDPDDSNKNFSRTNALIDTYQALHQLDINPVELFKTTIGPQSKEERKWTYLSKDKSGGNTLERVLGEPTSATHGRELRRLLFSKAELELDLEKGFKGHPSIGATIFGSIDLKEEKDNASESSLGRFISDLQTRLSAGGETCNLFLIGSLFGGTGAAGLPTLAKKIVDYLETEKAEIGNLRLGGAFIAPYFTFIPKGLDERDLYAKPEFFVLNTRAVLKQYDQLTRGVYDRAYLLGEQELVEYRICSTGGDTQNNRAHYVELMAALSALDFFEDAAHIKREEEPRVVLWGRRGEPEDDVLDWGSVAGTGLTKARLYKMTMLYASYTEFFYPMLKQIRGKRLLRDIFKGEPNPWYGDKFDRKNENDNLASEGSRAKLEMFRDFFVGDNEETGRGFFPWVQDILDSGTQVKVRLTNGGGNSDTAYKKLLEKFVNGKSAPGLRGPAKFMNLLSKAVNELYREEYVKGEGQE